MPRLPSAGSPERLRRLLVATDFSAKANHALERALKLPRGRDARLHIVHVVPSGRGNKEQARAESEGRKELALVARRAGKAGGSALEVTTEQRSGQPFVEIIRAGRAVDAELIVLGRHGARPLRDLFLGTTAERVIRKGDLPVLVVAAEPTEAYARPLAAVGLDDCSPLLLDLLARVLGPEARTGTLVHAYHVPFEGAMAAYYSRTVAREQRLEDAAGRLARFVASRPASDVRWRNVARAGDPRLVIVREAARRRADLVAIGTHARSGLAHTLLGSVAEWVIASAVADVLVARPVRFAFELP